MILELGDSVDTAPLKVNVSSRALQCVIYFLRSLLAVKALGGRRATLVLPPQVCADGARAAREKIELLGKAQLPAAKKCAEVFAECLRKKNELSKRAKTQGRTAFSRWTARREVPRETAASPGEADLHSHSESFMSGAHSLLRGSQFRRNFEGKHRNNAREICDSDYGSSDSTHA
ncbi:hypothetical protein TGP89_312120 [Toxoplasma gondii p89]|uniref:Uncharacterized protein n=1 Tax=Toxoplasma gondii p89 TaxID=943119 RepID=A0A086J904_TOXGO|nr:hypothetical protein TGP89_312120 [Toxoplasma gondii p89]